MKLKFPEVYAASIGLTGCGNAIVPDSAIFDPLKWPAK